jgi:hypothetical protein
MWCIVSFAIDLPLGDLGLETKAVDSTEDAIVILGDLLLPGSQNILLRVGEGDLAGALRGQDAHRDDGVRRHDDLVVGGELLRVDGVLAPDVAGVELALQRNRSGHDLGDSGLEAAFDAQPQGPAGVPDLAVADHVLEGQRVLAGHAAGVHRLSSHQGPHLVVQDLGVLEVVVHAVDLPQQDGLLDLQLRLLPDAGYAGVQAALLALVGQPVADVVVAEVPEPVHGVRVVADPDDLEQGVTVVGAGVVGVAPDPVWAAPPELAEVVRLDADHPLAVDHVVVRGEPHTWIAYVVRRKLQVGVAFHHPSAQVQPVVSLEAHVLRQFLWLINLRRRSILRILLLRRTLVRTLCIFVYNKHQSIQIFNQWIHYTVKSNDIIY